MAIVWLGSRWLQLEQPAASAVPFTQYRLLHDFGWEESGKNARQALKRTLLNLQEARWEGEVNDTATGKKTHEDHFGIIDRVLWPVVHEGRLERLGYIFLGSWFLEQLRHEAGVYIDWDVRDLPHRPQALRAARERPLRAGALARSGGRTGSGTVLRQRRLDLRPRARQRGRGGAPARRSPATRDRLPLQPRAGRRGRRLGPAAGRLATGRSAGRRRSAAPGSSRRRAEPARHGVGVGPARRMACMHACMHPRTIDGMPTRLPARRHVGGATRAGANMHA